jgi:hypothetical protein
MQNFPCICNLLSAARKYSVNKISLVQKHYNLCGWYHISWKCVYRKALTIIFTYSRLAVRTAVFLKTKLVWKLMPWCLAGTFWPLEGSPCLQCHEDDGSVLLRCACKSLTSLRGLTFQNILACIYGLDTFITCIDNGYIIIHHQMPILYLHSCIALKCLNSYMFNAPWDHNQGSLYRIMLYKTLNN